MNRAVTHEKLNEWLVPGLLAVLVAVLSWMAVTLNDISRNLAVATVRIEDHDRRLANLEALYLHNTP